MKRAFLSLSLIIGLIFLIFVSFLNSKILPKPVYEFLKWPSFSTVESFEDDINEIAKLSLKTEKANRIISDRADEFLTLMPSAEMALIHKGLAKSAQGDQAAARNLLELAQHRNPRNASAAQGLLYLTLLQDDFDAAIEQLDVLFRIRKSKTDQYLDYLDQIYSVPASRTAILSKLIEHPRWGDRFIENKISKSDDFNSLIMLVAGWVHAFDRSEDTAGVQERLLKKMLAAQDYDAVARFKAALGDTLQKTDSLIYDNSFQGYYAPRPLRWSLASTGQDYAEMSANGGLNVGAKGTARKVLASQLFLLPNQTNFELNVRVGGQFVGQKSRFIWQIRCAPTRKIIVQIEIQQLYDRPQVLTAPFRKPHTGCEAQTISLVALQSNRLKRVKMDVKEVKIISKDNLIGNETNGR